MKQRLYALGRLKQGQRNKTEARYEDHLNMLLRAGEILWHKFEGVKLRIGDNCFLTPDFFVMNSNGELEIHEVKGSFSLTRDDAMVKYKAVTEMYPFRFFLVAPQKKNSGWDIKEL